MPRNYVKGLKPRPDNAGAECENDLCTAKESSSWANGVCAGCRKRKGAPLRDVTNKRARDCGIFKMNYGLPLSQPQETLTATVIGVVAGAATDAKPQAAEP